MLDAWWSTTSTAPPRLDGGVDPVGELPEAGDLLAVSSTTSSAGAAGTSAAGTTRPAASSPRSDSGTSSGMPNDTRTVHAASAQGQAERQRAAQRVRVGVHVGEQCHVGRGA